MERPAFVEAPLARYVKPSAQCVTPLAWAVSLLALVGGGAVAQVPAQPQAADASKPAPAVVYDSAFNGYRPFVDPHLVRWREANDEMGRLGGHAGHLPGPVPPRGAPANPKPAADAGPAGAK